MTAFADSIPIAFSTGLRSGDALADYWLGQVTLRLRREVCWLWHQRRWTGESVEETPPPEALPPFRDRTVESLDFERYADEKRRFFATDVTAEYLTRRMEAVPTVETCDPVRGSFAWLAATLNLDLGDCFVLALGMLSTFDHAAGPVIAACQNDAVNTAPTLALAQRLWDDPADVPRLGDPMHVLWRCGVLSRVASQDGAAVLRWDEPLFVHPVIARQLLRPQEALIGVLRPLTPSFEGAPVGEGIVEIPGGFAGRANRSLSLRERHSVGVVAARLRVAARTEVPARGATVPPEHGAPPVGDDYQWVARLRSAPTQLRVIPVVGPRGSDFEAIVSRLSRSASRGVVRCVAEPEMSGGVGLVGTLAVYCWLRDVDLLVDVGGVLARGGGNSWSRERVVPLPPRAIPLNLYVAVESMQALSDWPAVVRLAPLEVPQSSLSERLRSWRAGLPEADEESLLECALRFRLPTGLIRGICEDFRVAKVPAGREAIFAACRAEVQTEIGDLADRVTPRFTGDELVLPHKQERELEEIRRAMRSLPRVHQSWGTGRVWNDAGLSVLFAGPPGTGKTMAAETLACDLDLPMYRIDLSQVVNKYVGETPKRLKRIFDAADAADLILFFEEADALFGKRTSVRDAHDRYANIEVNYLLTRMENSKGLTILATNRRDDLDDAFTRRLRFIIEFPHPDAEHRRRIWEKTLPAGVDASEVDVSFLAARFPLTGGHIRAAVFHACLQSASEAEPSTVRWLTMSSVVRAVRRELEKQNRKVGLSQYGPYAEVVEALEREKAPS